MDVRSFNGRDVPCAVVVWAGLMPGWDNWGRKIEGRELVPGAFRHIAWPHNSDSAGRTCSPTCIPSGESEAGYIDPSFPNFAAQAGPIRKAHSLLPSRSRK